MNDESDIRHQLIREYRWRTDESGSDVLAFLHRRKRDLKTHLGFSTFKELTLNYRILFDRKNKKKMVADYRKYVLRKPQIHKSDVAISYNMVTAIKVDQALESEIIDFMYNRISPNLTEREQRLCVSGGFARKHIVLEYTKKHIIVRTPKVRPAEFAIIS